MIPLGELLLDAPATGQHSTVANNCVPYMGYYGPFYAPVAYTPASTEYALGAFSTRSSAGLSYNFIGGTAKLQKITSSAWEDVSRLVGGVYATASENVWEFTTFGDRVIATNFSDYPQSYLMGTDTDFSLLSATAPKAKCIATVRGFVMLGNIASYPNRVQWSSLEDPTGVWTASATTQADSQDLFGEAEIGQVMKIVGGEYATIFMEKGIFRGDYVGGQVIFNIGQIIRGTGTLSGGSVAAFGDSIFFLGNDGFYQMTPAGLNPIGEGKINRSFFREVYSADMWRMSATIDPKNSLYIVGYPTAAGGLHKFLIYNWLAQRWTTVTTDTMEQLYSFYSESLDADAAATNTLVGNPDTGAYASVSADSALFIGGKPSLAGINSSHIAVTFDGAALTAAIETGENQLTPGRKTTVTNLIPMVEGGGTISVQVGYRNNVQESVSYSNPATVNGEGEANIFNTARYQRAKMMLSGGFSKAFGLDYEAKSAGKY
jgi:hypothetical protein